MGPPPGHVGPGPMYPVIPPQPYFMGPPPNPYAHYRAQVPPAAPAPSRPVVPDAEAERLARLSSKAALV